MSLRDRAVSGVKWSFVDRSVQMVLEFIIGIVLARLLSPAEFGLIGMLTIFLALSEIMVDSGLSQALIVKTNCTNKDYCTIYYTNVIIGLLSYIALYAISAPVSVFFNQPELTLLLRVLGINTIINSFGIVETTIYTKQINFKIQTKISFIASLLSGIIGIVMAIMGMGVWSLVYRQIIRNVIRVFLLHFYSTWRPALLFSIQSLRESFSFGSKLLFVSVLNVAFNNVYSIAIGKFFRVEDLGLYTKAKQFKDIPVQYIDGTVLRVSYPLLASISDDENQLINAYSKYIKLSFFVTALAMAWLFVSANEVIMLLLGEQWSQSALYLRPLCLVGMIYPLHTINQNIFKIKRRTDLFVYLELIKKSFTVFSVIVGVLWGLTAMLYMMVLNSIVSYVLTTQFTGRIVAFTLWKQLKSILPTALFSGLFIAIWVFLDGLITISSPLLLLTIKSASLTGIGFLVFRYLNFWELSVIQSVIKGESDKVLHRLKKQQK